jgi:aminotransferase EvaB
VGASILPSEILRKINSMLINNLADHLASSRIALDAAIKRVLDRAWLVLGPEVAAFEKSFASYIGVNHCIAVANGTDALELALRAVGIVQGDKVATVANAGMYTTTALFTIGAEPVFLDVDLETRVVMDTEIDRAIHLGVKAIVVTHIYGQAIPGILEISVKCHAACVALVEDCAQAHGARINGKQVGSFGDAGCFSFYPTKNLGALGDGGAVVTNNSALSAKVTQLRQYGWKAKYQVELAGACNSRLDEVQAAVFSVFLPQLDGWNARRREIAAQYSTLISHPAVMLPPASGEDYVAHLYVVRSPNRDLLRDYLRKQDIATDVHYPISDYRQSVFRNRFSDMYLPNTERLAHEVLTLPCYPEMTNEDVNRVINAVNDWPISFEKGVN